MLGRCLDPNLILNPLSIVVLSVHYDFFLFLSVCYIAIAIVHVVNNMFIFIRIVNKHKHIWYNYFSKSWTSSSTNKPIKLYPPVNRSPSHFHNPSPFLMVT